MTGIFATPFSATTAEPVRLRLPAATVFAERAARLRDLAEGHALQPFLAFLAVLAEGQQALLDTLGPPTLPDPHVLEEACVHHMPPLAPLGLRPDPVWRTVLAELVARAQEALPQEGRAAVTTLREADAAALEAAARPLLGLGTTSAPPAWTPFVAASLEVLWTKRVLTLARDGLMPAPSGPTTLCPVCGSHPVAAVVQIGGEQGLRYLHCSLCNSEWHFVRARCSNCGEDGALSYFAIEGRMPWVEAETCEGCGSYLKLVRRDRDPQADPVADDLASLALDLLLDEKNLARSGPNPYRIQS